MKNKKDICKIITASVLSLLVGLTVGGAVGKYAQKTHETVTKQIEVVEFEVEVNDISETEPDENAITPKSDPVEEETIEEVEYYEEPVYEQQYYEPVQQDYSGYSNGSGLTKSGGVNYHEGRKETWYSSNTLYHKDTANWTAGSDGVYRDKDGYVVVAASDKAQGSTIETSFGTGKVYDSGCANGVTDIYTNW